MWDSGTKWDSKVSCYRTYHTIFVTLDKYCLVENKYYVVFDKIVKNTANRPSGWLNLIQCFDNALNPFSASGESSVRSIKLKSSLRKGVPANDSLSNSSFLALPGER